MNELNNEPPIPDEAAEIEAQSSSQSAMLMSMLLLIAGFILSSLMFLHYGLRNRGTGDHPSDGFNLTALRAKGHDFIQKLNRPENALETRQTENPSATAGLQLFPRGDSVRWPRLKLTGFGSSTDGNGGFAIINGEQILPGQLVDGKVKVVEIRSQDVVVEYMGETRTLIVDLQKN